MMQFSDGNVSITYTESGLMITRTREKDTGQKYDMIIDSLELNSEEAIALIQMILMGQGAVHAGAHAAIMDNPFNLGEET